MSSTVAKGHRANRSPREHPTAEHPPPAGQASPEPAPRTAGDTDHGRGDPPRASSPATPATPATPAAAHGDDPRAVDTDVTGTVRAVLGDLLDRQVAAARATDPLFGEDLAARVAGFTRGGGKFARSRFVWWALRACGGTEPPQARAALRIGAALELIQTCALVHDDVMDDARLRRGRPALHVEMAAQYAGAGDGGRAQRFGQAAAILAGDLALAWADDVVADTEMPHRTARRVRDLWSAMRTEMVAGQYLDVQGEVTSARSLARAIRAACLKSALYSVERPLALGAALADAGPAATRALCSAGRCVGLAFQLRDDLLDAFGDARDTGKPAGGDIRSGKPTYLAAVARARAEASGDRWAVDVLRGAFGRGDASDAELASVREVFVATGARDTVEEKIGRLVAQGLRHLDTAVLEPEATRQLQVLMRSASGVPDTVAREVVPLSVILTAEDEGAGR
ncbi:polyprenyl synthetase family protein [Streptomyces sp. NPDC008196]|uniref:polyprenyl synthetase family protein n=1 Tax=unclassified Streptomyces TaxID=2593676 RepID=UPI0024765BD7|nr:polyprenyl synthetase family protein [Streptomyces sp. SAI-119]MDH6456000.1 geranylgeranyl diphosphate synthase type I [Streptomyces sp. SAI-119]